MKRGVLYGRPGVMITQELLNKQGRPRSAAPTIKPLVVRSPARPPTFLVRVPKMS